MQTEGHLVGLVFRGKRQKQELVAPALLVKDSIWRGGLGAGAELFAEDNGFGDFAHGFALLAA